MNDPTDPPMQMPAKGPPRERLRLRVRPDGVVLTDRNPAARLWVWPMVAVVGGMALLFLFMAVVELLSPQWTTPQPGHAVRKGPDWDIVIGGFTLGFVLLILLTVLMHILKVDRCFVVRVDTERREIVCRNKLYGWTTRRVEVPLNHADWDVDSEYLHLPERRGASTAGCVGTLVLFALGPLGLIIALINVLSRKNTVQIDPGGTLEVLTLLLREDDKVRAAVTVAEEATAEQFLVAWDEMAR